MKKPHVRAWNIRSIIVCSMCVMPIEFVPVWPMQAEHKYWKSTKFLRKMFKLKANVAQNNRLTREKKKKRAKQNKKLRRRELKINGTWEMENGERVKTLETGDINGIQLNGEIRQSDCFAKMCVKSVQNGAACTNVNFPCK